MKIKIVVLAILVPAILLGGILASMAADIWSTTSDKKPVKYTEGANAGTYNPADIRGSNTFAEISDLFGIDIAILYKAFGIPTGTDGATIQSKDLETLSGEGIGNESMQVFVAFYKGLPIDAGDAVLTREAAAVILESGSPTIEQQQYLKEYATGAPPSSGTSSPHVPAKPEKSGSGTDNGTEEDRLVKGSTTFQQVLDAGITREQIESITGGKMPLSNQTVKDYCSSAGLSFSDIKNQLNALLQ